jgi:hypothetical protein
LSLNIEFVFYNVMYVYYVAYKNNVRRIVATDQADAIMQLANDTHFLTLAFGKQRSQQIYNDLQSGNDESILAFKCKVQQMMRRELLTVSIIDRASQCG